MVRQGNNDSRAISMRSRVRVLDAKSGGRTKSDLVRSFQRSRSNQRKLGGVLISMRSQDGVRRRWTNSSSRRRTKRKKEMNREKGKEEKEDE